MTEPSAPSRRPATVTIAGGLLALTAFGYLADATGIIVGASGYPDRVRAAAQAAGVNLAQMSGLLTSFAAVLPIVSAAITIAAAVALLVLAAKVVAGKAAARIVAWVAVGLTLLCNVCGLGSGGASFSGIASVSAYSGSGYSTHEFKQSLPAGYPEWYQLLALVVGLIAVVSLATSAVLLALPASNAYFRRPLRTAPAPWGAPLQQPGTYATAPLDPQRVHRLSEVDRQFQRGELTAEQHAAERARILGS